MQRSRFKSLNVILAAMTLSALMFSPPAQAQESTLDVVKKRGTLIAGVRSDSRPSGYVNERGELVGFEVEVVKYIAGKLGVQVELRPVTSATRIPLLQSGQIDLAAAAMNITRERQDAIDFSIPHITKPGGILARKDSGIKVLADLAGKKIAFLQGSPPSMMERIQGLAPGSSTVVFPDTGQAAQAVLQGRAAALIMDAPPLHVLAKNNDQLAVVGEAWPPAALGIGVRENDSKWLDAINFALIDMWTDGTYHKLYEEYFESAPDEKFIIYSWAL